MTKADAGSLSRVVSLSEWRRHLAEAASMSIRPVNLAGCQEWSLSKGQLVHETGRFFQVVGLEWIDGAVVRAAPFLQQREIGLLATILRAPGAQAAVLIQVKCEPGNVGGAQFAPTCQATASNAAAIHGGALPPYTAYFDAETSEILADSLQSEQGSKFLGKRNRNLIVRDDDAAIEGDAHDWVQFRDFQPFLVTDFAVNTDLRSVLVTCDWRYLAGEELFNGSDEMAKSLRRSYYAPVDSGVELRISARLAALTATDQRPVICPLETLAGWQFVPDSDQVLRGPTGAISLINVTMRGREVDHWHQPIYSANHEIVIDLDCAIIDGLLRFGFRPLWEPGLNDTPELAPSRCTTTDMVRLEPNILMQVRQSDEGGRFLQDIATYRITAGSPGVGDKLVWLSLAEIQSLVQLGVFNNEARSVMSLLLFHI